jgi:nicotinic acid mononucleotide adenylyltransferase
MASAAFMRAGGGPNAIGIGLTAKVASVRAHRGPHHGFAANVSRSGSRIYSMEFEKDAGVAARERDGARADHLGLIALLDAVGVPSDALAPIVGEYTVAEADALGRERFLERPLFCASEVRSRTPERLALAFPGTFDPPHEGHFGMARAVEALTGQRPVFWITAEPPHKPAVPFVELLGRAALLRGHDTLFSRGDPLYIDKARRYPGCAFVIGTDSVARMLDPKWGPSVGALVDELRQLGTRFYVTSRIVDGALVTLHDLPDAPKDLCIEVEGRWDVSSTELRRSVRP